MTVPAELAETILVKCGRCCCVCRRFRPIQLQVHHIVPKSEGGLDELYNLTALCLTCHSDVHTRRPFTRRFTVQELRRHRDAVFELIADGKLLPPDQDLDALVRRSTVRNLTRVRQLAVSAQDLDDTAIELLVAAASSEYGILVLSEGMGGASIQAGQLHESLFQEPRKLAEYKHALQQLRRKKLVDGSSLRGKTQQVTHLGYLLADEILAAETAGKGDPE